MLTAINDDLFIPEVIADPYTYFGRLREEDPVHWNAKYGVWLITRYDDVVWVLRHQELSSSEVFERDPREPYPPIQESDLEMYNFVRAFFGDFFIQHDRPAHTEMRQVVHGYFTPKSMEQWRALVQSAITDHLDEAEAQGHMDVMRDFATPLPLLVIAQMLGMPYQDRQFLRELSEQLIFIGRGEPDRMRLTGGSAGGWDPALAAQQGQPGDGTMRAPTRRAAARAREAEQYGPRERPPDAGGAASRAAYSAVGHAHSRGQDATAARATEDPEAGTLPVRVCTGGAG